MSPETIMAREVGKLLLILKSMYGTKTPEVFLFPNKFGAVHILVLDETRDAVGHRLILPLCYDPMPGKGISFPSVVMFLNPKDVGVAVLPEEFGRWGEQYSLPGN